MMHKNTDRYAHWRQNLAGLKPPITEEPQDGFYKRRLVAKGPFVAAAIWHDETGKQVCRVGTEMRDVKAEWLWLAKNPADEEAVLWFWSHGVWPDGAPAAPQMVPSRDEGVEPVETRTDEPAGADDDETPGPGHNSGDLDAYGAMVHDLTAETENARNWLRSIGAKISDAVQAAAAADKITALRAIAARAEAWKTENVEPLYRTYKTEQDRYTAIFNPTKAALDHLLKLVTDFQKAEKKRLADEAAAVEAQRAAVAAENAKREAAAKEQPLLAEAPLEMPDAIDTSVKIKGFSGGRAINLRKTSAIVITDFAKALKAVKDEPEIAAAVLAAAKRLHKEKGALPAGTAMEAGERAA